MKDWKLICGPVMSMSGEGIVCQERNFFPKLHERNFPPFMKQDFMNFSQV